jgi:hypothetical protein
VNLLNGLQVGMHDDWHDELDDGALSASEPDERAEGWAETAANYQTLLHEAERELTDKERVLCLSRVLTLRECKWSRATYPFSLKEKWKNPLGQLSASIKTLISLEREKVNDLVK